MTDSKNVRIGHLELSEQPSDECTSRSMTSQKLPEDEVENCYIPCRKNYAIIQMTIVAQNVTSYTPTAREQGIRFVMRNSSLTISCAQKCRGACATETLSRLGLPMDFHLTCIMLFVLEQKGNYRSY